MQQLSEQAKKLIEDFEREIETVPAEEREAVLKRMTSHISALNEDVERVFKILQKDFSHTDGSGSLHQAKERGNDINNISDFI